MRLLLSTTLIVALVVMSAEEVGLKKFMSWLLEGKKMSSMLNDWTLAPRSCGVCSSTSGLVSDARAGDSPLLMLLLLLPVIFSPPTLKLPQLLLLLLFPLLLRYSSSCEIVFGGYSNVNGVPLSA